MEAYGFQIKNFTEFNCVVELMKLYQALAEKQKQKMYGEKCIYD